MSSAPPAAMRLYGHPISGNCLKPAMLLERLGLTWEWVQIDILAGAARTEEFRRKSPHGRVPVLEPLPGVFLAESNAILCYLAEGTPWLPAERLARARVLGWLFFEQNHHEPSIATARALRNGYYDRLFDAAERAARLVRLRAPGEEALATMERRLGEAAWLAGESESVADLSLYAYTHLAGEGGFELAPYPGIRAWLGRVEAHPRHLRLADLARR